ncbi:hypothetical protein AQUCO_03300090v1 [Aquilegia coerulea]|uniref:Receptor-like serine/threonine-protein kinase n=1 Tax=Aquilegia coerulea TaxID=218851 RepID=A0A2G5CZE7_AQUCA|nr:hypothetical protein AQUCO_03300090v1 [Aquilegia coerulea]
MAIRSKPWFILSFMLLLSCNTNLCIGSDSITVGQSLSGKQTLISQGGTFELGFFKPGNSSNYYLGIWYKKISVLTVVWVANRNDPVRDPYSSKLTFLKEYGLSILDASGIRVWASCVPSPTVAMLLDNGNLVLKDGSSETSLVRWESFYNPTDTWLPGAKLGCNKYRIINGLTSWRSPEDPSAARFLLLAETNKTKQLVLRNVLNGSYNAYTYWTSSWNGKNFSIMDRNILKYVNFSHVFSDKGSYFSYSVYASSIPTRLVLDLFGRIQLLMWADDSKRWDSVLLHLNICGSNSWRNGSNDCKCLEGFEPRLLKEWNSRSWSGGCARNKKLQCPNQGKNTFFMINSIHVANNSKNYEVENIEQCKKLCLATCYCTAYAYSSLCTIWGDDLYIGQQVKQKERRDLHVLVLSELTGSTDKVKRKIYIVAGSIGATIPLGILLLIVWKCRRKNIRVASGTPEDYLLSYKYRELQRATKNFSEELGKGGFGSVFRGTLPDSTAIAVKTVGCLSGEKQFRAEVNTIGMIHHKNLIRLRGFCAEGTKRLLVYDYMPNSSLNQYLFRKDFKTLDWKTRYNIALGIARGLAYLHEKCREYIIHCDIKPENILLDAEFNPKVADFGLAKLLGRDFSRVLTSMRGTRGYLAPEWISGVAITTKADVYSFGMMLFEIVSGRRNLDMTDDDMIDYFPAQAASKVSNGEEVISLLDRALDGNAEHEELVRVCRVACWCIQEDEKDRPSMGKIVQVLEGGLDVAEPPIPRFLQLLLDFPKDQEHISTPDGRCMAVIRNMSTSEGESIHSWTSSSLYTWFPFNNNSLR